MAYTSSQRHSFGNLLFRVRSCRLQVLEGAYSDTKHSGYTGRIRAHRSIRLYRYRQQYAGESENNNGCGTSEVTSNVHEVVDYQLDDIRIYLSTEFGNGSIGSRYEIPTR